MNFVLNTDIKLCQNFDPFSQYLRTVHSTLFLTNFHSYIQLLTSFQSFYLSERASKYTLNLRIHIEQQKGK